MISSRHPGEASQHAAPPLSERSGAVEYAAALAARDLPLAQGLSAYSEEAPRRLRSTLRAMARGLDAGRPLEEVLAATRPAAPQYLRTLLAAATRTGRLAAILDEHLYAVRRTKDVRVRVWISMSYPLFLVCFGIGLLGLLLLWPVPMMKNIFTDFGVSLPIATVWLLRASDILSDLLGYWPVFAGVLAAAAIALWGLRFVPGRAYRTWLFQLIPLFGMASRELAASEFCALLAMLVDCRVALPEALRMAGSATRDANLREGSRLLAGQVELGLPGAVEILRMRHFPKSLAVLFRWTEKPAAFADGLRAAAELHAVQARMQAGLLATVLQPFALVVIAGIFGFTVFCLLSPMFALLQALT